MDEKAHQLLEHYMRELGYTCSESSFLTNIETIGIDKFPPEMFNVMSGFMGGMCTGRTCGAISGGIAALALKYAEVTGHESPLMYHKIKLFFKRVEEELGVTTCAEIREMTAGKGCFGAVEKICQILREVDATELDLPRHSGNMQRDPEAKKLFLGQ